MIYVKPGPLTTGLTGDSSQLVGVLGSTITVNDDQVIEDVRILGTLTVLGTGNLTLRNVLLNANGNSYGIMCKEFDGQLIVEDSVIEQARSAGIHGNNYHARRCEMRFMQADAFKGRYNFTIESCWIHHIGSNPESHADGLQMIGGNNAKILGNFWDLKSGTVLDGVRYRNDICVLIQTHQAIDDVEIVGNWFHGGGFALHVMDKGTGAGLPTNTLVAFNRFSGDHSFGEMRIDDRDVTTLYGNVGGDGNLLDRQSEVPAGVEDPITGGTPPDDEEPMPAPDPQPEVNPEHEESHETLMRLKEIELELDALEAERRALLI